MAFKEISPYDIQDNPFSIIGRDWQLFCAGADEANCNTMTASWGQLGVMWNKPVACIYIRPQRYTREFVEREARFSVTFFEPGTHRSELNLLGSKSGRDGNKIAEAGLTPMLFDGVPAFEEAHMVLVCRKLYQQDLEGASFLAPGLDAAFYPDKDYHRMYIGEIEKVFVRT